MTQPSRRRRKTHLGRSRVPLALVAVALFGVGLFFGVELAKPPPPPDFSVPQSPPPSQPEGAPEEVPGEMTTDATREAPPPVRRQPPPGGDRPRIALIVDDLGRSVRDVEQIAALGVPVTYAVLPFEARTREVVAELRRRRSEYLCHLPMEAKGGANPGPGALLGTMSRDELIAATRRALDAVPGAAGVNNHMGSLIASQPDAMQAVLSVLVDRDLYFLDSRTSADTLGYTLAREAGLQAGERQVFLDPDRDRELIRRQFEELLETAEERGGAIGIAHPYPETLEILRTQVPQAVARGFEFVVASALLEG